VDGGVHVRDTIEDIPDPLNAWHAQYCEAVALNADLLALGDAIWTWRATTQPLSGDDIPRIERPAGWTPDWSPDAVEDRRRRLKQLQAEHAALLSNVAGWSVGERVDYRLLGSALARVSWELDILQGWRRNPLFYVHQTVGALFETLLPPPPFDGSRTSDVVRRLESIPSTLDAARENLAAGAVRPFAQLALGALEGIGPRLEVVAAELAPLVADAPAGGFDAAMRSASRALDSFADWLRGRLERMAPRQPIGRDTYIQFLRSVAIVDLTPEQIVAGARQDLERAIAFEALEIQRNRDQPDWILPQSIEEQIQRELQGEQMLRGYCEEHDLVSFPDWLRHYRNLPMPNYLLPLRGMGVTDDLTSRHRLNEDGVHYIPAPRPDLPYFYLAMARDPRTLIAHEGVHYYQLARSWAHEDPIRRFYYDSGPNEGIGFYAEEMLLQAGLFDDSPRSREIIYNFMRLRAVRVEVDVQLALGSSTVDEGAGELARRVPMDIETAREEAALFASEPGQAISYQMGKLQILGFLADTRRVQGDAFKLRDFHDALLVNGNVPIALQRWETLSLEDQVPRV
jgi:hypothetical protein